MENKDYIQKIVELFNADNNDPTLNETEKVLLKKILEINNSIGTIVEEIDSLNGNIKDTNEKIIEAERQLIHLQGKSQGLVESLVLLNQK